MTFEDDASFSPEAADEGHEDLRDPKEDLRAAAKLRNAAMSAILQFETRLLSAVLDDSSDDEDAEGVVSPVPEFLEEEKERLRELLYESLRHIFLDSKDPRSQFSSRFYEEAVYHLIADRVRRTLGYYHALRRAEEEISQNNREIGDPNALEMSLDAIQKTLTGLDEVDFVRNLGISLGLFSDDLDAIVRNVISKEFAPLRRREQED